MHPFIFVLRMYCFLSLKRQKKLSGKGRIQVFLSFPLYFTPLWYLSLYNLIFLCTYTWYITMSYVLYFGYFGYLPSPLLYPELFGISFWQWLKIFLFLMNIRFLDSLKDYANLHSSKLKMTKMRYWKRELTTFCMLTKIVIWNKDHRQNQYLW